MSDDFDPASDLHDRLAKLESSLTCIRTGKAPPQPVDLLSWRAAAAIAAPPPMRSWRPPGWRLEAIARSLHEDWEGLSETVRTWAVRFEARLGR